MLSKKSIRSKFFIQLAFTTVVLVVIFSIMSYQILKISIIQNESEKLINDAKSIINNKNSHISIFKDYKIINIKSSSNKPKFSQIDENNIKYLVLTYPYNTYGDFLIIKKDITQAMKILDIIFISIFLIVFLAISLAIFYALFLSRIISLNLKNLSIKISKFDDDFQNKLKCEDFPIEFQQLVENINHLISRIENYNMSQKELFIGIAHELKTPLAVMKAKNDVTLIKKRDEEYYLDTIKNSNNNIDRMNNIINAILKIGRLEGAQFEEFNEICIIDFIKNESKSFSLLTSKLDKNIILELEPETLKIKTQATLLSQILQNFIQNAIKFSYPNSDIIIKTSLNGDVFSISVLNEGEYIDENKDYFAPFKRYGSQEGVGLGLFLSKTAATALKSKIYLKNRTDAKGVCSILEMKIKQI